MRLLTLSEISQEIKMEIEQDLKIDILDYYEDNLGNHDILKELLTRYDPEIVVVSSHRFDEAMLEISKSLKLIICTRGNPVNVDSEAAKSRGIHVTCTPARNANAVAEYVIGLIICIMRGIPWAYHSLIKREATLGDKPEGNMVNNKDVIWVHPSIKNEHLPYLRFRGSEIMGKRLGVVGFGSIGRLVAEKAHALGMQVAVCDPFITEDEITLSGVTRCALHDLLQLSDVVSLHAKQGKSTDYLIDTVEFETMKKTAVLVNTARGSLINQKALIYALKNGLIQAAALDVFEYEPLWEGDELLDMDNILFTPHIGGASVDVVSHHSRMLFQSLLDFVHKRELISYSV